MAYYIGDIPSEAIVLDPPETITLGDFDTATAELINPAGTATTVPASIDTGLAVIIVDLPNDVSLFLDEGVYRLRIRLASPDGYVQRIPDVPLVAQDPDSQWHTLDTIRDAWADAEIIPDALLWQALEVVKGEVLTFAPALADGTPIPENYRAAQRDHLRNKANAAKVTPDGGLGQDDFIVRPFPLDWHVKATLRPKRGIGAIG